MRKDDTSVNIFTYFPNKYITVFKIILHFALRLIITRAKLITLWFRKVFWRPVLTPRFVFVSFLFFFFKPKIYTLKVRITRIFYLYLSAEHSPREKFTKLPVISDHLQRDGVTITHDHIYIETCITHLCRSYTSKYTVFCNPMHHLY